jgi:dihydrofolate synthase/folylpolyglutamate synthase
MRVGGAVIPESEVVRLAPRVRDALSRVDPALGPFITYEIATALAFLYFREAGVQSAVIEVGLGGRLDATNVVTPLVSVITSISYDHMNVLGNTLGEIAREKAGILKPGVPAVTSASAPEAVTVLERIAAERGSPLTRVGPAGAPGCAVTYRAGAARAPENGRYQLCDILTPAAAYERVELALLGEHQIENAAAAVAAVERLRDAGYPISEAAIRAGLRDAHWPARLQVVRYEPLVVVDGAHNADSFAKLFAALRRHFSFERLVLVLGLMSDKDQAGIAAEIACAGVDTIVTTAIAAPRAAPPEALAALLATKAPQAHTETRPTTAEALDAALRIAGPHDLVCIAGSLYIAGEALRWLAARPGTIPGAIEIAGVDH